MIWIKKFLDFIFFESEFSKKDDFISFKRTKPLAFLGYFKITKEIKTIGLYPKP